jgi:hypothetical protein
MVVYYMRLDANSTFEFSETIKAKIPISFLAERSGFIEAANRIVCALLVGGMDPK